MLETARVKNNRNIINLDGCNFYETPGFDISKLGNMLSVDERFLGFYSSWYVLGDKLYYFKKKRKFTELFMQELIKEFDLEHVNYQLAICDEELGVISENFKKPSNRYYDFDDYFYTKEVPFPRKLTDLSKTLEKLLSKKNKDKFMDEIFRLTAFDWFSGQTDRTDNNLIIMEENGQTSLAPIFDNGMSLIAFNTEYTPTFDKLYFASEDYSAASRYLLFLIANNKTLRDYLTKSLDINIRNILKRTLEKYKLEISYQQQETIEQFFDFKKELTEKKLKLIE